MQKLNARCQMRLIDVRVTAANGDTAPVWSAKRSTYKQLSNGWGNTVFFLRRSGQVVHHFHFLNQGSIAISIQRGLEAEMQFMFPVFWTLFEADAGCVPVALDAYPNNLWVWALSGFTRLLFSVLEEERQALKTVKRLDIFLEWTTARHPFSKAWQ